VAQQTVRAARFYTAANDGLVQVWRGRVWLNPPYVAPLITQFVAKLCAEYRAGRVIAAILLTHNYTDAAWFHQVAAHASAICFARRRISFSGAGGDEAAPAHGQAFSYFGDDVGRFAQGFADTGFIVSPWRS